MTRWRTVWIVLLGLSLLAVACVLPAPETPQATRADPQAVLTSAARTAEARRLDPAAKTQAVRPGDVIETAAASHPTASATLASATASPYPTTTPEPGTEGTPPADDKAQFMGDVTVPDGTVFYPNESFVKTWKLQNIGESTWTQEYDLTYLSGDLMGGATFVPLAGEVAPGEIIEISVDLTAPLAPGEYRSYWKVKNAHGQVFGVGEAGTEAVWVAITVTDATPVAATTSTLQDGHIVTAASIKVDKNLHSGTCPHTFTFTTEFTLNKPATIAYNLESENDAGFEVKLPPPAAQNLEAGTHTVVYELTFSTSLNGWVRLHITQPVDVFSNKANFTLACQ